MANFLVRIELYDADGENYEDLHDKMNSIGFKRTVLFEGQGIYALPNGTYIGKSTQSAFDIRERVKLLSAPLTSRDASIFVCSYNDGDWSAWLYPDS